MCAASPMQGAVLRCAGSAIIWRFGTSGNCRTISSRRWSLVSTQMRSGGSTGRSRSTVCWISVLLAEEAEHLLGISFAAARPETGPAPARQDQAIVVGLGHAASVSGCFTIWSPVCESDGYMKLRGFLRALFLATLPLAGTAVGQVSGGPLIVLIGPPLSGKTTQISLLEKRYGIPTIATDDIIQAHASDLQAFVMPGQTLRDMRYDPSITRYLRSKLDSMNISKGIALDGFPATVLQSQDLRRSSPTTASSRWS